MPEPMSDNPLAAIDEALRAITVHVLVNADDEETVRRAVAVRRDLPPIEVHTSQHANPPAGQMYVWTGDQVAGNYNIHAPLTEASR